MSDDGFNFKMDVDPRYLIGAAVFSVLIFFSFLSFAAWSQDQAFRACVQKHTPAQCRGDSTFRFGLKQKDPRP